jgi:putative MATE family efflux protein
VIKDLTKGSPLKVIASFAIPMILGNIFQLFYNIIDSIIVGRYIGPSALAAVGSSYTIMVFLTSILIGLCMGAGVLFSQFFGAKKNEDLKQSISTSFIFIGICAAVLTVLALLFINEIIVFMNVPYDIVAQNKTYLKIIFYGIFFTFLYNWSAGLLRALGNSKVPLYFLILSMVCNIVLDILFIVFFRWGIAGAAYATILSMAISSALCFVYCIRKIEFLHFELRNITFNKRIFYLTTNYSLLTSIQQSIMNFGILMIQGLVNSFGTQIMAAFAVAVKIDTIAYIPMQDYGNAFSTYIAQNKGAGQTNRIKDGFKVSMGLITIFGLVISALVWIFASKLMLLFVAPGEIEVIATGITYLRIEGVFYFLIGYLFMFYGFYRGLGRMKMSVVLTVISLGTRVLLAYSFAGVFGTRIIWYSIVIGWILADLVGLLYYKKIKNNL